MLVYAEDWVGFGFSQSSGREALIGRLQTRAASPLRQTRTLVSDASPYAVPNPFTGFFEGDGYDASFEPPSISPRKLLDVHFVQPVQGHASASTGAPAVSQPAKHLTIMGRSSKSVSSSGSVVTKDSYCEGDDTKSRADVPVVVSTSTGEPPGTPMALPDATRLIADDREHASVLSGSIWLSWQFFTAIAKVGERVQASLVSTPPRTEGFFLICL